MPYQYIRITPQAAPLSEVMDENSEYSKGVQREMRLVGHAQELLDALILLYNATPDNQGGALGAACRQARKAIIDVSSTT